MSAKAEPTTGIWPLKLGMALGGVLGQLPLEKAFDLARNYHVDRKKQAEKLMTQVEQQKMAGLYAHIIHGDWSEPKNAHRRRQHAKTVLGKEWECLNTADRNQSMAAYVIMVDQIHKGFEGYVSIRVKRIKEKERKKGGGEPQQVYEAYTPPGTPPLLRAIIEAGGAPMVQQEDDLEKAEGDKQENSTEAPGGSASGSNQQMGSGEPPAGGSNLEEFDATQPSGSGANSERDDESCNDGGSDVIEAADFDEEPIGTKERGTNTCDKCLVMAEKRLSKAKKKAAKKNMPKPVMVDAETQTILPPKWYFELRRHFMYNDAMDVRYLLDTILGKDIDEKFVKARSYFINLLQSGQVKLPYNFTVSMVAMIGVIENKDEEEMSQEFEDLDIYLEDYDMYLMQLKEEDMFVVMVEFVINVYQTCVTFKSQLSAPLIRALDDYLKLRDSEQDENDIDILSVDDKPTEAEKAAKYFQAAKSRKRANQKKAKKRNTDVENCLRLIGNDIKKLREIHAKEIAAKVAAGEIPEESVEDSIKNHRCKHTLEDCDDTIEYYGNRVWELYKAITPNVWTTEDILKWCAEKIATKATN